MKSAVYSVLMIFGLAVALSGCAPSKTYLIKVNYLPQLKAAPIAKVAAICPFEDVRKETERDLIGLRHHGDNKVDFLKVEGESVPEAVTQAVQGYFVDNGFQVTDCKGWDMSPEGLDRLPGDLAVVVGGKIESLMVEANSGVMTTNIQYTVRMSAHIGKVKERTVVTRAIESMPTEKKVGFDPEYVEKKLNAVMTEALQNLLAECLVCE